MIKQKFVYEAIVLNVHDGDTITVEIDLGFQMKFTDKVRFLGIDAPELKVRNEDNKLVTNDAGQKSLKVVAELLPIGSKITIETIKDKKEKYGRYLATVYVEKNKEQINVNKFLLSNDLAKKMK
jgi:micrococcal nuclease